MKTLNGFTYAEIHSMNVEEYRARGSQYVISQVGAKVLASELDEEKKEKFMEVFSKHAAQLFDKLVTEETLQGMRFMYDTEERFNVSADLAVKMGDLGQHLQVLMEEMWKELLAEEGIPL